MNRRSAWVRSIAGGASLGALRSPYHNRSLESAQDEVRSARLSDGRAQLTERSNRGSGALEAHLDITKQFAEVKTRPHFNRGLEPRTLPRTSRILLIQPSSRRYAIECVRMNRAASPQDLSVRTLFAGYRVSTNRATRNLSLPPFLDGSPPVFGQVRLEPRNTRRRHALARPCRCTSDDELFLRTGEDWCAHVPRCTSDDELFVYTDEEPCPLASVAPPAERHGVVTQPRNREFLWIDIGGQREQLAFARRQNQTEKPVPSPIVAVRRLPAALSLRSNELRVRPRDV